VARSAKRARVLAKIARRLFMAAPMPDLVEPAPLGPASDAARIALRVVS
jgi:hypothetical protein